MKSSLILATCFAALAAPAWAQGRLTRADSQLVGRILLAEDRRDSASPALAQGLRHADERVRQLARRAGTRISDPSFLARDSFPVPALPPAWPDPAWRLRYRALAAHRNDCAVLRGALADSAWPVRFRAAALVPAACGTDTALVATLRDWANRVPASGARAGGGVSWHPAGHALVALARIAPQEARGPFPLAAASSIPWLRAYAARAAAHLLDTAALLRLAGDPDDNVKEAAVNALAGVAEHAADEAYLAALSAGGYQAVRAGARALRGSRRRGDIVAASLAALHRLRRDSSETSRDARIALLELLGEAMGDAVLVHELTELAADFDCAVADSAAALAARVDATVRPVCRRLPVTLAPGAVALALGREVRLRVVLADSSGGGSFVVRLRGDVAPIMAARILALARAGWYHGRTWHRVEPDFVLQGAGGGNEYVGHPRFIRDELDRLGHQRGTVGMSTRGHDTGDAQWFVNLRDNPRLTRDYTVFAEVLEGIEVVDGILEGDVIARITVEP